MFVKVIYNNVFFNHSCYRFHWDDLYTCNELHKKRERIICDYRQIVTSFISFVGQNDQSCNKCITKKRNENNILKL